jgi:hypothetical protein
MDHFHSFLLKTSLDKICSEDFKDTNYPIYKLNWKVEMFD